MIGYVNLDLLMLCDPDDEDKAIMMAEYMATIILAQASMGASGAGSWLEDLFD